MLNRNTYNLKKLKHTIGDNLYKTVVAELGGEIIRISSDVDYFDKPERNNIIRDEYNSNKTISRNQLACKYNLSLDRIHKILATKPQNHPTKQNIMHS